MGPRHRRLPPVWPGFAVLAILLTAWSLSPTIVRGGLRERALDILRRQSSAGDANVAIVDIDHAAIARFGPWPWPRAWLARVVAAAAAAKPAAIGLDILLAGQDAGCAMATPRWPPRSQLCPPPLVSSCRPIRRVKPRR